ncbi:hypothetical protein [Nitrosospira briensis]|uniref:hypothetical protein n=1 Tax=Nitrosospira briensis TaxID=35799 RepID=UPI000941CE50|nr:hypothetical protein [Nitrosospira briensis]
MERKARKVLERAKFDDTRLGGKIAWRRWKTHNLMEGEAAQAAAILLNRYEDVIFTRGDKGVA